LTAVSVLQVGVSLQRKWVGQDAIVVQADEVPAFGSEPGAEPSSSPGTAIPRVKSIHLFWPATLEEGGDSKVSQPSYF